MQMIENLMAALPINGHPLSNSFRFHNYVFFNAQLSVCRSIWKKQGSSAYNSNAVSQKSKYTARSQINP